MKTQLSGYLVSNEDAGFYRWMGFTVCCPGDIRQAIADNPQGETLIVEINSGGGSVTAGSEIYSLLRGATCPTESHVLSLSASAASFAMCGADKVLLSPAALTMVHLPMTMTQGNQDEHQRSLQMLESVTESILNCYELRCQGKSTRDDLRAMMQQETWLSAQDAIDAGLADGILDAGGLSSGIQNVWNSADGMLPDSPTLRAAYLEAKKPPQAELQGDGDNAAIAKQRALHNLACAGMI